MRKYMKIMEASEANPAFKSVKAPGRYDHGPGHNPIIFLAGSIDQGAAMDWQRKVTEALSHLPVTILNPRRDDWDPDLAQDISEPKFREQVEWEMDGLDHADLIVMYFDKDGKSPITLLELGLHADTSDMAICCPDGFWRRGNVQIVADRYEIPMFETLDDLIEHAKEFIER